MGAAIWSDTVDIVTGCRAGHDQSLEIELTVSAEHSYAQLHVCVHGRADLPLSLS